MEENEGRGGKASCFGCEAEETWRAAGSGAEKRGTKMFWIIAVTVLIQASLNRAEMAFDAPFDYQIHSRVAKTRATRARKWLSKVAGEIAFAELALDTFWQSRFISLFEFGFFQANEKKFKEWLKKVNDSNPKESQSPEQFTNKPVWVPPIPKSIPFKRKQNRPQSARPSGRARSGK